MGYLYVDVSMGKDSVTVLNLKYTKAEIRDKLLVPEGYPEEFVEKLLARAVYLKEPLTIKCKEEEGVITTQIHNRWWYIHWGEKITITPDGFFNTHERSKIDQFFIALRTVWEYVEYFFNRPEW